MHFLKQQKIENNPPYFQIISWALWGLLMKTLKDLDIPNKLLLLFAMDENSRKCIFMKFTVL